MLELAETAYLQVSVGPIAALVLNMPKSLDWLTHSWSQKRCGFFPAGQYPLSFRSPCNTQPQLLAPGPVRASSGECMFRRPNTSTT